MSSHSIVGLLDPDGSFKDGVQITYNAHPVAMGPALFELLESAGGDVHELWNVLDSAKHIGWATLTADSTQPSGLGDRVELVPGFGERFTERNSAEDYRHNPNGKPFLSDCYWAYALDLVARTVTVFKLDYDYDNKQPGYRVANAKAVVSFDEPQPSWAQVALGFHQRPEPSLDMPL